jgi:hypothetical protein
MVEKPYKLVYRVRADARALLMATGYRMTCPLCGQVSYPEHVALALECSGCLERLKVRSVFHAHLGMPILPGVQPGVLYTGLLAALATNRRDETAIPGFEDAPGDLPEVRLLALRYKWLCPECDVYGDHPAHSDSALAAQVDCPVCGASYRLGEVRHRVTEMETPRDLLRHCVDIVREELDDSEDAAEPELAPLILEDK